MVTDLAQGNSRSTARDGLERDRLAARRPEHDGGIQRARISHSRRAFCVCVRAALLPGD